MDQLEIKSSRIAPGSRFVFPPKYVLDGNGIKTIFTRSILLPWVKDEESMSWSRIASYERKRGILWDDIIIETSGGTNTLDILGISKGNASKVTEFIDQQLMEQRK